MRTVALDSQILIWGLIGQATANRQPMIERARRFLKHLDGSDDVIIVPAPVVAEILVKVPEAQHPPILKRLNEKLQVPPFDIMAASAYAALHAAYMASARSAAAKPAATANPTKDHPPTRDQLKADLMILAVALVRNVTVFYTEDQEMIRMARERLTSTPVAKLRLDGMPQLPGGQLKFEDMQPPKKE